jgi:hypothetical protein
VSSTSDSGENTGIGCDSDCSLDIAHIEAACYEAGLPGDHAIPNRPRLLIAGVAAAQKTTFESTSKKRIGLLACPIFFTIDPRRIVLA